MENILHIFVTWKNEFFNVQNGAEESHDFQMASTRQGWGWW
jgi:hypothetical protein